MTLTSSRLGAGRRGHGEVPVGRRGGSRGSDGGGGGTGHVHARHNAEQGAASLSLIDVGVDGTDGCLNGGGDEQAADGVDDGLLGDDGVVLLHGHVSDVESQGVHAEHGGGALEGGVGAVPLEGRDRLGDDVEAENLSQGVLVAGGLKVSHEGGRDVVHEGLVRGSEDGHTLGTSGGLDLSRHVGVLDQVREARVARLRKLLDDGHILGRGHDEESAQGEGNEGSGGGHLC